MLKTEPPTDRIFRHETKFSASTIRTLNVSESEMVDEVKKRIIKELSLFVDNLNLVKVSSDEDIICYSAEFVCLSEQEYRKLMYSMYFQGIENVLGELVSK